jgi:PAS domain S-box-containing protein
MWSRNILTCLIILLSYLYSIADLSNNSKVDSLLKDKDAYTIEYLLNLSQENSIKSFDSAESILLVAKTIADSLRETDNQIQSLLLLGHLYFDNGYFENAQKVFSEVLSKFSNELTDDQMADVNHSLGLNHIRFNNYDKSLNLFQEALLFYEKTNNKLGIARALKDIGAIYFYLGNENSALDYYQKALIIYRELNDIDGIAKSYNNIGMIFKDKGNFELALDYLNRSLKIKQKQNNKYGIANTIGNIGAVYIESGQYDKAISFFNQALEIWKELEYLHGITEVYNYLGEVYIKMQEYQKALESLLKCQEISLQNNFKQRLTVNYELLSEVYYQISDFENSIIYLKQYSALKDSLYESVTKQKINEYLVKYENAKTEKELVVQDKKILQQRFQIIGSFIILFTVIILLILLIRQNRAIKRRSKKIQKINKELDKRVYERTSELRISRFSIDIAVDAIIWMKRNGSIVYVNNAAMSMLGYTKQEFNQITIFDLVSEFSEDTWQDYWQQLKNKGSYVIQLYYKTKMGNEIPVEVAFNFQDFENEEFNFTYTRNISERKISEEKLKNAKERAEHSDKLKSAFLANMSHEIRTPMNAINGFISLLGDPDIENELKNEILEYAQSSSNELLNIVNDIIDISKIEADELVLNKSLYYVNGLISETYKVFLKELNFISKKELQLRLELSSDSERIAVYTDQNRFKQIMNNLVNNAIKFTEKGEIVIGYKQIIKGNRKLLSFYVKDTGIGIPESKIEYIFDRFNQVSDDRDKKYKGTGLGLAICKKLIDLLGGDIGVNSKEDEGSVFYFTLPYQILDNPDESLYEELETIKRKYAWPNKSILVVEDTPSNYYLIENYLRSTQVNLVWAKSGKEALEIFEKPNSFDLILMDIQLPGINGYEATKLIKAHNKNIPVIAQTAYALAGEREYSLQEGCDDYLSKPIKKETLLELLVKYFQ